MRFTLYSTADLFNQTPSDPQWLCNNAAEASKPGFLSQESEAPARVEAKVFVTHATTVPNCTNNK